MSVTIANVQIIGNEVDVSISSSVLVESHPWLMRDSALNSRSDTGNKSIEVEVLSGVRVLMQSTKGNYCPVPLNNDPIILSTDRTYSAMQVSIQGTAVDTAGLLTIQAAQRASLDYYIRRKILLNKINDNFLTYETRKGFLSELDSLSGTGLAVSVPGVNGTDWEFLESNSLNISYWSNGPYADIKLSVVSKKLITF
jgi:hypothetical protein